MKRIANCAAHHNLSHLDLHSLQCLKDQSNRLVVSLNQLPLVTLSKSILLTADVCTNCWMIGKQ